MIDTKKEVSMQRRRPNRLQTEQGNLFHPKRAMPTWETFPLEIRREVAALVVRMLSAYHARCGASVLVVDVEVEHD